MRYTLQRSETGGWHVVWAIDHSTYRAPVFADELRSLQGVPEVNEDVHGHYVTHDNDTALDVMNLLNRLAASLTLVDVDYDPTEGPLRHQFRRKQPYANSFWW
jgi:hypothetical protein